MAGTPRIVCLSAESADICARLGVWDAVVGVTTYARQTGLAAKPVIGGFSKTDLAKVVDLHPDLVFTFSDVQAAISAELIRAGLTVVATNPRSLEEISNAIRLIARVVDRRESGEHLAARFTADLEALRVNPERRPRVYFEEWPDPCICGIRWVSEIVEWCGGTDVFHHRRAASARDRTVTTSEIIAARPEVILASWCGKPVDIDAICQRPGFSEIPAVRDGRVYAINSADILQPGPSLIEGAREISRILGKLA